jgi:hypothetical protein
MKRALVAATITLAVLTTGVGAVLAQSGPGFLTILTNPPEPALIFIDDAGTNLFTPQTNLPLSAGHHSLTVIADGGRSSSLGFSIASGQHSTVTLSPH